MALSSPQNLTAEWMDKAKARYRWVRQRLPFETGNYPYVTARVKAKRALLLPKETYDRLLVMEIPEIARFLGEREYKTEMVALGARVSGVDLIEDAVTQNLAKVYNQIYEFSEGNLRAMVGRYLDRYDLENVKAIVRSKAYGAPREEVLGDLVPAGSFGQDFLEKLVDMESLEEVFEAPGGTICAPAFAGSGKPAAEIRTGAEWEARVSRLYYADLLAAIPPSTDANRLMRQFVQREIDLVNLKTLLRAWDAKAKFEREIFLDGGDELDVETLHELVGLDKPALLKRLADYSFYEDLAPDLDRLEETGIGALMRRVEKQHLLEAARYAHMHPLSILPILDYIVLKDREVQNIRIIARGKESGLSMDVIRGLLVV